MHEKIYKAFHQDISIDDYKELDELKKKFEGMKPFNEYEKDGLKSYDDAFLVRFTYESNAIEGSTLSLGDTELVLEGEFTPNNNQRLREIFSARGCADGCAYIEKELENDRKFTEDFIKDIHERTTLDCQPRIRGTYRIAPVYIQGSLTESVDPIQIRELIPTLLYAYENSDAHPIAKVAAFHAMFENIHPFQDGNGRTGRMILYRECLRQNIMPFIIHNENRIEYISSLNKAQTGGDYADLVTLFEKEQLKYTEIYEYFNVEARYKYYLDNTEEDITIGEVGESAPRI
mgnify:CR=1 FL=1